MQNIEKNSQESEIEFRVRFKKEFGVDWLVALDKLEKQKSESQRKWNQLLITYGIKI